MPQVNSFGKFNFNGLQGTSPPVSVPLTPNPMFVVILQASSPSSLTEPSAATAVYDNMGNQYTRVKQSSATKASSGTNISAFTEIWIAQSGQTIPAALQVTAQYPTPSVVLAEVVVLTPTTNGFFLGVDSGAVSNGGSPVSYNPQSSARTVNAGITINTTGASELLIGALTYLVEVGSPTAPTVVAAGLSTLLDNQDSGYTAVGDGAVQSGLAIVTANAANAGNTLLSANLTLVGGQSAITFYESIAIAEGPFQSQPVPQFNIQNAVTGGTPIKVAQVASLTPPLNVIQLPLSQ